MSIIVSREDGETTKLTESTVGAEKNLQEYIYKNPECLPLDEYKEEIQFLILTREFPTPSGAIDALGVDRDGEIYLIETKLYKNPDKRTVLAQVLDYGAALWHTYDDPAQFLNRLEQEVRKQPGDDLHEQVKESFGFEDQDLEGFLTSLRKNVSDGNFRFVVLMDRLQDRLKDLITFVNTNSRFDVFGAELEFYRDKELQILVPSLYGAEVKKTVGDGPTRGSWSEESFFEDAEDRLDSSELESVRTLYHWASEHADRVDWGTGTQRGSFNPKFDAVSQKSILTVYSDGQLQLNFGWLGESDQARPFAERLRATLKEMVEEIPVPEELPDTHVYVPVETWGDQAEKLTGVIEGELPETGTNPDTETAKL